MAAVCQVTGAVPGFGHNISHSHRRTKRRFDPNVQKKTYFVPSLGRNIKLNVSAKGIKLIDARGIRRPRLVSAGQGRSGKLDVWLGASTVQTVDESPCIYRASGGARLQTRDLGRGRPAPRYWRKDQWQQCAR